MAKKTGHRFTLGIEKDGANKGKLTEQVYEPEKVKPIGRSFDYRPEKAQKRKQYRRQKGSLMKGKPEYNLWLRYLRLAKELHEQGVLVRVSHPDHKESFYVPIPDPEPHNTKLGLDPDTTFGDCSFDKWLEVNKDLFTYQGGKGTNAIEGISGEHPDTPTWEPKKGIPLEEEMRQYREWRKSIDDEKLESAEPILPIKGEVKYHTHTNVFNATYHRLKGLRAREVAIHDDIRATTKEQNERVKQGLTPLPDNDTNSKTINEWLKRGVKIIWGVCYGIFPAKTWEEIEEARGEPIFEPDEES